MGRGVALYDSIDIPGLSEHFKCPLISLGCFITLRIARAATSHMSSTIPFGKLFRPLSVINTSGISYPEKMVLR